MFYRILQSLLRLILTVDVILITIALYCASFFTYPITKPLRQKLGKLWYQAMIHFFKIDLKLHQKNKFPLPQQYILIGNHPSVAEDIGMPLLFKARFLAKIELRRWPILGRLSVALDTLYVDRNSNESRRATKDTLIECLKNGENVAIFPEGGCKGRRINLPFLYGAFDISLKTGVPILPVFLHYEAQETFEWLNQSLYFKLWQIANSQNKTANYYVFDAIDPKQFHDQASFCHHVENLYLQWQAKYLE